MKNFSILGVGGYVAPKHLNAIKETGNHLINACDVSDRVGVIDSYFPDAEFFTDFYRFERHFTKSDIDYLSICTPNYMHDHHIRFGLQNGCDVICEKPLVLEPHNLYTLLDFEQKYGKKVNAILQLRLHPEIIKLKQQVTAGHSVYLNYVTPRGKWYDYSWKGNIEKSGGICTNIGIHLFDMLLWVFGGCMKIQVIEKNNRTFKGVFDFERGFCEVTLSINGNMKRRSITVDGKEINFTNGFDDLHTESYRNVLSGKGFSISDTKPSIELVEKLR